MKNVLNESYTKKLQNTVFQRAKEEKTDRQMLIKD